MPGFNQTGPMGQGAMTGRKMGLCTKFGANLTNETAETKKQTNENSSEIFYGRGFGFRRGNRGRGFGMGRQNRFRGGQS